MKPINIYLSPYAYYARLNFGEFEKQQEKGNFKKWMDNDNGQLPYEFIEFRNIDISLDSDYPEIVKNLGLLGSNLYCHHPFDYKPSSTLDALKPMKLVSDNKNEIHFFS